MLNLAASSPAVRIERLRLADAVPMALQVSWVPASLCPGLEHEDLEHHSLFGLIESKFGLAIGYARETIEAREASARESQLLGLRRAGVPVLYVERIVYLQDDTPIEFVQSVCRSDTYKFSIQLVR
jgi:GntR family transcriptional regulator